MTKSTTASTDPPAGRVRSVAWSPSGAIYLGLLLAGLAVGLWPEAIHVPKSGLPTTPPPALRCVALAQVAFVLLIYPLVLLRRAHRVTGTHKLRPDGIGTALESGTLAACDPRGAAAISNAGAPAILGRRERADTGGRYLLACAAESAVLLLAAVPFYVAAAWLSDAVVADAVRTAICIACLLPVAWSAGAWFGSSRRPCSATPVLLALAALGLPAAYYVVAEFVSPGGSGEWLWDLAPATLAWTNAAPRAGTWLPRPLWALLVWPAAAVAGFGLRWLLPVAEDR